jgi:clathrin heavy chain
VDPGGDPLALLVDGRTFFTYLFYPPCFLQVVKEYTTKVDQLVAERKEAAASSEAAAKEAAAAEAQRNAYATLMPLALPAPGMGGESYYSQPQAGAFPYQPHQTGHNPPGFGHY